MKIGVYKATGIIIKKTDLGDTAWLLTIYTQEYGKIQARAKGVRKITAKLKGYLELFTYSQFLIAQSKTIDIITDVVPINSFLSLHSLFNCLDTAFRSSELIDKLAVAPESDERLWQFIFKTFDDLDKSIQPKNFEEDLLEILGYGTLADRQKQAADFIQDLI